MAVTHAHFFASVIFFPVIRARIARAQKKHANIIFSRKVFPLDSLKTVISAKAKNIADSVHSRMAQYLMPFVGGCRNSFISFSDREGDARRVARQRYSELSSPAWFETSGLNGSIGSSWKKCLRGPPALISSICSRYSPAMIRAIFSATLESL